MKLLKEHNIRMRSIVRPRLQKFKEKLQEKAVLLYMVYYRENNREIYSNLSI